MLSGEVETPGIIEKDLVCYLSPEPESLCKDSAGGAVGSGLFSCLTLTKCLEKRRGFISFGIRLGRCEPGLGVRSREPSVDPEGWLESKPALLPNLYIPVGHMNFL